MTQDELKSLLSYDPETGRFKWHKPYGTAKRLPFAGCLDAIGYRVIRHNKINYKAHRMAWLYVYGRLPAIIDHINGDRDDNRLCNLREATPSQNVWNSKKHKDGSGPKGTYWDKNARKWGGVIHAHRVKHYLGLFDSPEEAAAAYAKAAVELHGDFARTE